MAAVESGYKSAVSIKLNGGVNPTSGGMIVKSFSLGKVVRNADADKIMNVVGALMPVLDYGLARVERTETTVIELA